MQEAVSYEMSGPVYGKNYQSSIKNVSENGLNTDLSPILITENSPQMAEKISIGSK